MGWGSPFFVLAIVGMTMAMLAFNAWVRARHGSTLVDTQGSRGDREDRLGAERQIELLSTENTGLKGQVSRLEERIAVLERIATDPAERTAREIDGLR